MRIIQANLCLRFLPCDGWTRESVRLLLREDKRLERVLPRYYDERDRAGRGKMELNDGFPHEDCDYFVVYDKDQPFLPDAIAEHEIV